MTRVIALLTGITISAAAAPISVQLIDAPWSAATTPSAINSAGQVVGVTDGYGFLYSGGSHTPIQRPNAFGSFSWGTTPTGISENGTIVGTSATPEFGISGFVFENGAFSNLAYPAAQSTYVYGSSSNGTVVGNYYTGAGEFHGFLWSPGTFSTFDAPVQFPAGADFERVTYYSVNAGGTILGGQEWNKDGQSYALLFLWDGAAVQYLPQLGNSVVFYPRLNDNGTVAGSYYDTAGTAHGFLYRSGSITVLDVPDALATYVNGINNIGQLTGGYYSANGVWHAFIGTEAPEPASGAIAFGGLVALALARKTWRERPVR